MESLNAGYTWQVEAHDTSTDVTEYFSTEDLSGYKLVIKSELDAAISSAYHHAGTKTCVELVAGLLVAGNEGNVYNMTDSGTTTADFIEGAGQPIKAGDNVGIAKISDGVYKFDLLSGFVDTTNFVQKSQTAGLLKNDGTVDTTIQGDVATLRSGFTNLDNEVNGDATVYPYADVITIPDAVPSNLADCSVKIEPVQDLHGYSQPWVGGAGKNKYNYVNGVINVASYTEGVWTTSALNGYGMSVVGITQLSCEATDYVVSFEARLESGTGSINLVLLQDDTGNTPASESRVDLLKPALTSTYQQYAIKLSFSSTETVARVVVQATGDASSAVLNIKNVQIEKGSVASSYEPYSNICPISGHTEVDVQRDGKNWFNVGTSASDYTRTCVTGVNGNVLTVNIKANAETFAYRTQNLTIKGNVTISYKASSVDSRMFVRLRKADDSGWMNSSDATISGMSYNSYFDGWYKENYALSNSLSISIPNDCIYWQYGVGYGNAHTTTGANETISEIQIELGSTATPYAPYAGKTYTIALGDTIYGGTVDFDSGVMTVDRAIKDLGTLTWVKANTSEGKYEFQSSSINDAKYTGASLTVNKCSCFKITTRNAVYTGQVIGLAFNSDLYKQICVYAPMYADASEFTTAMNGQTLCYELATPTTINLTPQQIQLLKGTNTISASTGQISVTVNGVSGAIGAVQEQVNDIREDMTTYTEIASVTADGTKTMSELLLELKSSIVANTKTYLYYDYLYIPLISKVNTHSQFGCAFNYLGGTCINTIDIISNTAHFKEVVIATDGSVTVTDKGSVVPSKGTVIKLVQ